MCHPPLPRRVPVALEPFQRVLEAFDADPKLFYVELEPFQQDQRVFRAGLEGI